MATIKYFVGAKKTGKPAKIYLQLVDGAISASEGRKPRRFIVPSGQLIDPGNWSNKTEAPRQRLNDKSHDALKRGLSDLRDFVYEELRNDPDRVSQEWLQATVNRFYNKPVDEIRTLNDYLNKLIESMKLQEPGGLTKDDKYYAPGSIKVFEGLKRVLNEYQGIYTEKRIKELKEEGKQLRPHRLLDFIDIDAIFHSDFSGFLLKEGYKQNTRSRFIKNLKTVMRKAYDAGLHSNYKALDPKIFRAIKPEKIKFVYLTEPELIKLENIDLSKELLLDKVRDVFLILCETGVRISDYRQIETGFYEDDGYWISISNQKTEEEANIPCSDRFMRVWNKYKGKLPQLPDPYINKYIKGIAYRCGIVDEIIIKGQERGISLKRPKYELITCHTGRRTAITNMLRIGMPVTDIMVITGHTNPKQVLEYYQEQKRDAAKRIAKKHADYFSGKRAV